MCGIQRTAVTFMKMKFCLSSTTWSMPMPPSSPHSRDTKWRSASQESKSIVNYVMLFLWAITDGSYLAIPAQAPQNWSKLHSQRVHFCQRLKNTSEVATTGLFLLWTVLKEEQAFFKYENAESCPFIYAVALNDVQVLQLISLLHWHSGWKL